MCTPSRVQLMTGIYNNRNYLRFGLLDPDSVTFANILRDSGYDTCIAGKWQLEGGFEGPVKFGFDRYCLWQLNRRPNRYANPGFEIDGKEVDFKNGEFGPDVVTDYICKFLEEKKASEKPFVVYYSMMLPHWPFVPTPGNPDWDPTMWRDMDEEPRTTGDNKHWKGMVEYTDKMVGKVVAKLDETGLRDNTIVIFTGDNGTHFGLTQEFRGRMVTGGKGKTIDDGTHVPFIVNWPGKIAAGKVSDDLVDFSDILPTLVDLGKAKIPESLKVDGKSLAPAFLGQAYVPRETSYCWYQPEGNRMKASQHTRTARYKLYATGKFYDTEEDPLEKNDLAAGKIPEELVAIHTVLKAALDQRIKETEKFDSIQIERKKAFPKKNGDGG